MAVLDKCVSRLNLTKEVKENAAYYYRKMVKKGLIKGRSIEEMVLASLYAVLKINKRMACIKLLNKIPNLDFKKINKYSKLYQKEFKLNLPPTRPHELIPYFCSSLSLSGKVESKTIKILEELLNIMNISGKNPSGLASAALYYACLICNERRTQKEISDVAGITEATLRQNYRIIKDKLLWNIR